ncbi:MAG: ABC transporter permease [Acidobacteriia bacterium]|nr:ABC transporter permease [Terriglobia bacterium]
MSLAQRIAWLLIAVIVTAAALASWIVPASYDRQFRDEIQAPPSKAHPLGTDELGRDRLSRLLHGTQVSLLLAPAAAFLATLLAALAGTLAGWRGGWLDHALESVCDLTMSLPWMFLLLTVRAALPLDVAPMTSVAITFFLLGALGWAGPARVVRAGARALRDSDYMLMARAQGYRGWRLPVWHLLPGLRPVLTAQFWTSVPLFILAEANLSLLGLGVVEPMPSWGGLLKEMESLPAIGRNPWILAPAVVLLMTLASLYVLMGAKEEEA